MQDQSTRLITDISDGLSSALATSKSSSTNLGHDLTAMNSTARTTKGTTSPATSGDRATRKTNIRNRSNTILLTHDGVTKPLGEWAEEAGVDYYTGVLATATGPDF